MDDGGDKQALRRQAVKRGERADRLAAALRANLAKRKEQGRARARRKDAQADADGGAEGSAGPSERSQSGGQTIQPSHDSAEIIAEKDNIAETSASQAN